MFMFTRPDSRSRRYRINIKLREVAAARLPLTSAIDFPQALVYIFLFDHFNDDFLVEPVLRAGKIKPYCLGTDISSSELMDDPYRVGRMGGSAIDRPDGNIDPHDMQSVDPSP